MNKYVTSWSGTRVEDTVMTFFGQGRLYIPEKTKQCLELAYHLSGEVVSRGSEVVRGEGRGVNQGLWWRTWRVRVRSWKTLLHLSVPNRKWVWGYGLLYGSLNN